MASTGEQSWKSVDLANSEAGYVTIHVTRRLYRNAVYSSVDDAPEITVQQLPKFKAEATELIGADGVEALAVYLIDHPDAGDVIPGSGGVRKLRWAAKGEARRCPDHLCVRRGCRPHLPDAVLREERESGFDR